MDHLLLLESGTPDSLLLEDGFDLLLESSTPGPVDIRHAAGRAGREVNVSGRLPN